jgi:general secretion pathway protein K
MLTQSFQKGIALIQVLLLSAILSMMALHFTLSSRQQVNIANDLQDKIQAEVEMRTLESEVLFSLLTLSRNELKKSERQNNPIAVNWNFFGKPFKVGSNATVSFQDVNGMLSVTKVAEADIEAAFGLAANAKKKLSVTFVLDADAADITLAPYYRENESRVNVMSDQYKK